MAIDLQNTLFYLKQEQQQQALSHTPPLSKFIYRLYERTFISSTATLLQFGRLSLYKIMFTGTRCQLVNYSGL